MWKKKKQMWISANVKIGCASLKMFFISYIYIHTHRIKLLWYMDSNLCRRTFLCDWKTENWWYIDIIYNTIYIYILNTISDFSDKHLDKKISEAENNIYIWNKYL